MALTQSSDTCTDNAAILSPLWTDTTLSNGSLKAVATGNSYQWAISTIAIPDSGKWTFEAQSSNIDGSSKYGYVGLCQMGNHNAKTGNNYIYGINAGTGEVVKNASALVDVGSPAGTSLWRIEYDADADTIKIFDDGAEVFPASTGVSNTVGLTGQNSLHFFVAPYGSGADFTVAFKGLSGTPTTGYKELTTANLLENSAPAIKDGSAYHQGILWSGNSSSQTVSQTGNSGFTPDMTIIKSRSFGNGANIYDVVRGSNKGLATFDNGTEDTESDGVTFGISSGKGTLAFTGAGASGDINNSGRTYVGLTWKAGGSAGSNGNGSITSSVSAETTSGFSIVSWEGSGGNATIGHGLGVVPKMIWIRNRDTANNWVVYHVSMGNAANLHLDDETAKSTGVSLFQSTDPTTTVFSVDGSNKVNKSGDEMIAYCFADVPGFQKLGFYKGNGNTNGPFVETGFKPAFVLIRSEAVSTNTEFFSNIIEPTNIVGDQNFLNIPNAEADNDHKMDWLSNGFKIRDTSGSINASGANIIYWAIGENSFAGNTPVTAR